MTTVEVEQTEESLKFPERWKTEFEGLIYLGYLDREVRTIPFHTFTVRTLTVAEKIDIGLLTKEYVDTVGFARAYRSAVVAAGLVSVDNRPLILGVEQNRGVLREKFRYVTEQWHDAVIDTLFKEIDELEGSVLKVLEEMGLLPSEKPVPLFKDQQEGDEAPKDSR